MIYYTNLYKQTRLYTIRSLVIPTLLSHSSSDAVRSEKTVGWISYNGLFVMKIPSGLSETMQ